ncbi:uncharacterized protein LOC106703878 isoform X1 [Latimeria chalumnae]|uniref:uncharacterized protein LOC106703878 isoform X1 n=1 Tax=Latimeria chalumnae TaxID=7897 RepID=UPI0006D8E1D6|nr:PREDICTED: uncharacterized protein LOC106703878 isoform X1 [Latimeria chalumnae]|eukprot:XP_014345092.1 PREDICTED: uncharacterized protein LOC106703878 isoform X1 [Latimeria chalumnae]
MLFSGCVLLNLMLVYLSRLGSTFQLLTDSSLEELEVEESELRLRLPEENDPHLLQELLLLETGSERGWKRRRDPRFQSPLDQLSNGMRTGKRRQKKRRVSASLDRISGRTLSSRSGKQDNSEEDWNSDEADLGGDWN